MRPKGVIALLSIVLLVGVGLYFFLDDLIEKQLESTGASVVGAKVEIDNLELSLAGLSISWDRLQVANRNDTWKNLFETGQVSFDMEVAPLARKKLVINDVSVTDIRLGTARDSDGSLPQKPGADPSWLQQATDNLQKNVSDLPVLNLSILKQKVNIDSLMATFDIRSVARIEEARGEADLTFRKWTKTIDEFDPKGDLTKIEGQVNALKSAEVSNLQGLVTTAGQAKDIIATLNSFKKELGALKQAASHDLGKVTNSFASVDDWITDDFNSIRSKANIGDFTPQNVGKMLFGDVIVTPTIQTLEYVALARKYMPVAQKLLASGKVEKPPRFEGQDIRFPLLNAKPDFLMEHILISAASNHADTSRVISLQGEVAGVTSQPRIYGKPLTFALDAMLPDSRAFSATGALDHVTDIPSEQFSLKADGVKVRELSLPQRPYLPSTVIAETANLAADFSLVGETLAFKIGFSAKPVQFRFGEEMAGSDVIARVTREVFDSVDELTFSAGISGAVSDPGLKISSNIDDILARRISALIGGAALEAKNEIRGRIDAEVGPKKQEALAFVSQNSARISSEVDAIQKRIDDQLSIVEERKRELESEIDKKKKQGLEGAKDKLKDLFKKKG